MSYSPPSRLLTALEGRAFLDMSSFVATLPLLRQLPRGDGHPVLVLPGYLTSSRSTTTLRWFLKDLGYAAHRWKLGTNYGFSELLEAGMQRRIRTLHRRYGKRVSLLGWSLGGVYARELARALPDHVRLVMTMGSPFKGKGTGTRLSALYEMTAGHRPEDLGEDFLGRMNDAPPVPVTAMYTRTDGIVHWNTTVEDLTHDRVENIEVGGAHCGLGFNPRALMVIADRLAQSEGNWQPFRPWGPLRLMYGKIENSQPRRRRRRGKLRSALS